MSDDPAPGARSVRSSSGRFSVPVPVLLAEAIGERYTLERELARGGMATVYLGQDHQKLQAVAIKVMHPKLATVLGAERFLREIRVAKSMDHPPDRAAGRLRQCARSPLLRHGSVGDGVGVHQGSKQS